MQFYIIIDGKKSGPHTDYDMHGMVRDKTVTAETRAWHAELDGWKPMGEIPALESLFREAEPRDEVTAEDETAPEEPSAEPNPDPPASPRPTLATNVAPWRRLCARMLDTQLFYIAISLLQFKMGKIDNAHFYQPTLGTLLSIFAIWILVESLLLTSIGSTPGKLLLNLRIVPIDGIKLGTGRALKRSLSVWWRGFGLGFVPLQVFCGVLSYVNLKAMGTTPWDVVSGTRVEHGPIGMVRVILLVFLFISLGHLLYSVVGEPPYPLLPPRDGGGTSPLVPET